MSKVFLLDSAKVPLDPIHPGRARLLLKAGQAAVYRRYPFTLILKEQVKRPTPAPIRLKIDPGAKTTDWPSLMMPPAKWCGQPS